MKKKSSPTVNIVKKLNRLVERGELLCYEIRSGKYVFVAFLGDNRRFTVEPNGDITRRCIGGRARPTTIDRVYRISLKSKPVLVYSRKMPK